MIGAAKITDRRVLKTRLALRNAFLELLPEKGWDELSVQDICDQANVGRSTFYIHFQNKEELLSNGLNDLREGLRQQALSMQSKGGGAFPFVRGLIEHMFEQKRIFRSIVGRRSGHVVQTRFRELILQLVGDSFEKTVPAGWERDAAIHYIAGALFELLSWSVDDDTRTAEEIERCFQLLSLKVTASLAITLD